MMGALMLAAAPICAARMGLGALFLRASINHGRDLRGFSDIVAGYRLLPGSFSGAIALGLLGAEIAAGGSLLGSAALPGLALGAGGLSVLLLSMFAAAMAINLRRGRLVLCGCGDNSAPLSWAGFALTAGLIPLAALCALPTPAPNAPILAQAAVAGIVLLVLHDAARLLLRPRLGRTA